MEPSWLHSSNTQPSSPGLDRAIQYSRAFEYIRGSDYWIPAFAGMTV
jgi:hypothetical protein